LRDHGSGDGAGGHARRGQNLLRRTEGGPAVVRDVHPDLAGSVEVVVHQHDLGLGGLGGGGQDGGGDPVAVDAEGRAAGAAGLRDGALAVGPARTVVHGLPDVGLERGRAFAAGQVAEIDRVGLVGGQAVVTAVGIGGGDLGPAGAAVVGAVGDGAAAGGGVVEDALGVRDDRGFAAVGAHVGDG